MTAMGFVEAAGVAGFAAALGLAAGAVCAHPDKPTAKINIKIANTLRMKTPDTGDDVSVFVDNVALYDSSGSHFSRRNRRNSSPRLFCRARRLCLQLVAHALHLAKHAHQVSAEKFLDVLGAVAANRLELLVLTSDADGSSQLSPARCDGGIRLVARNAVGHLTGWVSFLINR
jgi:hypothetical protein